MGSDARPHRQIDRDTLTLMGVRGSEPMLSKNDGTASFGEITTIAESPLDPDVLWVGVDDGNIQVSRDGGKTWDEVSRNLPTAVRGAYGSRVLASAKSPGSAYVTLDAHRDGDFAPYVFYTADFGRTWVPRHGGLPTGSVKAIAEDPENPDLLFLGTEHALYAYAGRNPPDGTIMTYYLKRSHSAARLVVSNSRGDTVRVLAGPSGAAIERVNWDLRHEPPPASSGLGGAEESQASLPRPAGPRGPFVAPGKYTVFLEAGGAKASAGRKRSTAAEPLSPDRDSPAAQGAGGTRARRLVAGTGPTMS